MPKPVAEVGEGHEDASGNGVYCFIRDLIVEGRDARFVNKEGRYVINWSRALKCYHDYKSKRNPQYKSKNISRRKASNGLRAALLNFYKKEGAKEYNDGKRVNENNEVVERQFQMPPRVFESLFGSNVQLSDDGSEHETSSIISEADEKPLATPNSSDSGFDEAMDISDDLFNANEEPSSRRALGGLPAGDPQCSNVETEEEQVDPSEEEQVDSSDITTPCQMFDISEEELDLVLGEICSNSDTNDIDLLGVVRDICPSSGSVKGGMQFYISLTEELSENDKSGIAHFDGIGDVYLERLNCYTLAGTIPASQQPGPVPVTVNTQDGRLLGMTYFMYVDEVEEVLKQVVKDQALQSLFFTMWSQEHGFFGSDDNLVPFTLQGQGSSVQGTHAQALKGLQLLVYTAAQTNAQQFIQMIFSTSAGRLVFNAYKDRPQLPEDVARANGHDDLAQYLHNVNARLSKENSNDAQPSSIDWFELIEAVNKIQKQSSVVEDETDLEIGQSKGDDNESDYFADAETSSCGSFELEIGWSDSEDGEVYTGPCSKGGGSDKEPDVKSASSINVMSCKAYMCAEVETQSDNDLDLEDDKNFEEVEVKEVCDIGCFGQQIGVAKHKRENTSEREQDPRACLDQEKSMQLKSPFTKDEQPKKEPDETLTPCMEGTSSVEPTVSGTSLDKKIDHKADGKNDRKLGTTEVGKSHVVGRYSIRVTARKEEASIVPSQEKTTKPKRTRKWLKGDAVTTSSQQGTCVNETQEVPSFREQSCQSRVTGGGTQNRENIDERKKDSTTGPSQAKRHKQHTQWRPFRRALLKSFFLLTITVITVLCLAAGIKLREGQLLHWAVRNGHIRISQALLKFVSDVDAPNFHGETPLHVASMNGYKDLAELFMKLGSNVNSKDYQQQTPLHLAAWSGCQEIANDLIRHGSDVNARDDSQQTPLHLAALNGHRKVLQVLLQHGSDVNAKQRSGWTPLHLAAFNGHKEIGEVLVQHGSVINIRDNIGCTPLHLAMCSRECNEAKINYSFDLEDKSIQNGTNKLLIWSELPVKEIAYEQNHLANDTVLLLLVMLYCIVAIMKIFMEGAHKGCRVPSNSLGPFSRDEQPKKEADGSLTQKNSMERISCEARLVLGTNLDNEIDQKADGKNDGKLGTKEAGKSSLISQLSKKVSASGKEEEASTVPTQEKTTKPKGTRKWLKGDVTTSSQQGTCVCETQEVPSFRERIFQRVTGGGTQNRENINDRKEDSTTGPSQAKRHSKQKEAFQKSSSKRPPLGALLVTTVLCLAAGIEFREGQLLDWETGNEYIYQAQPNFVLYMCATDSFYRTLPRVVLKHGYRNLLEVPSNAKPKYYQKQTILHLAAWSGCQEITDAPKRHGSDVKARGDSQQTALHLAAVDGHRNVLKVFIQRESDVNAEQRLGWTPLHLAALVGHKENLGYTPLHLAAMNGHLQMVQSLTQRGSDVEARDDMFRLSVLHLADDTGHRNIAEVLIQSGSGVNATDFFEEILLRMAVRRGDQEITEFLIQHGSKPKTQDDSKRTPKITQLFGVMDKCIKNGTSKVLILGEETANERHHLVNATELVFLIKLTICICLCIELCTPSTICAVNKMFQLLKFIPYSRKKTSSSRDATACETNGSQNGQTCSPVRDCVRRRYRRLLRDPKKNVYSRTDCLTIKKRNWFENLANLST